jgi:hypothetical protein
MAFVLPPRGAWTIDDSVKRIAAENAAGPWYEFLGDGAVRAQLPEPEAFPPLQPPFAQRQPGGFAPGFSPWSRALAAWTLAGGEIVYRLLPVLAAILFWIVLERAGIPFAFLLLPLTFYALVPWEYALSWLFAWPAVWYVTQRRDRRSRLFASGLLLALAIALRLETAVLAVVLAACLIVRVLRRQTAPAAAAALALGVGAGLGALALWHTLTSSQSLWLQLTLNLLGHRPPGLVEWLAARGAAAYGLLLRMDGNIGMSLLLVAVLLTAVLLLHRGESRKAPLWRSVGLVLAVLTVAFQTYRIWSSPLPPLTLLTANSLIAACPWVLALLFPPFRGRTALLLAAIAIIMVVIVSPVWEGVHWGPRLLLFALPLLLIDIRQTERYKSRLFTILLGLTLIPTVSSAVMVFARARETSDRARLIEPYLGTPVVCTTMSLCADLAPLWPHREFFTAAHPRELRRLLIELRFAGIDTVWLHLEAHDDLYPRSFPGGKPVAVHRMTVTQSRSLYRTFWRTYELVMNRGDALWATVLENEAGRLLNDHRPQAALRLQSEAVTLAPDSAAGHNNLALIYAALGQTVQARGEAILALSLDPSLEEPRRLLEQLLPHAEVAP